MLQFYQGGSPCDVTVTFMPNFKCLKASILLLKRCGIARTLRDSQFADEGSIAECFKRHDSRRSGDMFSATNHDDSDSWKPNHLTRNSRTVLSLRGSKNACCEYNEKIKSIIFAYIYSKYRELYMTIVSTFADYCFRSPLPVFYIDRANGIFGNNCLVVRLHLF